MITQSEVQKQLQTINAEPKFFGRGEARELEHIIVPGETIAYCLRGRHEGGFATLCITDMRIVLVDKKPFYLTLEDLRYDMISEVDFSKRLIDSTITICTVNKQLKFTSFKGSLLRKATGYVQGRVMEFRQQHMMNDDHLPIGGLIPQDDDISRGAIGVKSIQHRVTNPYTKVPLVMRRRASRFYGG